MQVLCPSRPGLWKAIACAAHTYAVGSLAPLPLGRGVSTHVLDSWEVVLLPHLLTCSVTHVNVDAWIFSVRFGLQPRPLYLVAQVSSARAVGSSFPRPGPLIGPQRRGPAFLFRALPAFGHHRYSRLILRTSPHPGVSHFSKRNGSCFFSGSSCSRVEKPRSGSSVCLLLLGCHFFYHLTEQINIWV